MEKFPICGNEKRVLKSKQNYLFLNSTPAFCYLMARVCIWVSISLAYNASCDRSHFWSIRSQIPACCRAGLLSLTEMFHYCVDSAATSYFECRPHTNDSVLKAADQVLMWVWNVYWVTIGHKEGKAQLIEDDNKALFYISGSADVKCTLP